MKKLMAILLTALLAAGCVGAGHVRVAATAESQSAAGLTACPTGTNPPVAGMAEAAGRGNSAPLTPEDETASVETDRAGGQEATEIERADEPEAIQTTKATGPDAVETAKVAETEATESVKPAGPGTTAAAKAVRPEATETGKPTGPETTETGKAAGLEATESEKTGEQEATETGKAGEREATEASMMTVAENVAGSEIAETAGTPVPAVEAPDEHYAVVKSGTEVFADGNCTVGLGEFIGDQAVWLIDLGQSGSLRRYEVRFDTRQSREEAQCEIGYFRAKPIDPMTAAEGDRLTRQLTGANARVMEGVRVPQVEFRYAKPEAAESPDSEPKATEASDGEPKVTEAPDGDLKATEASDGESEAAEAPDGEPEATGASDGKPETTGESEGKPKATGEPDGDLKATESPDGEPEAAGALDGKPKATGASDGEPKATGEPDGKPEVAKAPDGEPEATEAPDGEPGAAKGPEAPRSAIIHAERVDVHAAADRASEVVAQLASGAPVTLLGSAQCAGNGIWHRVRFAGGEGYVGGDVLIILTGTASGDALSGAGEDERALEEMVERTHPDRSIAVSAAWNAGAPDAGSTVTLTMDVQGYEGLTYRVFWQCDAGDGWETISEGETAHTFVLDEANANWRWRAGVRITGASGAEATAAE